MIHVSAAYDLAGLVFAAVAIASALARGERKRLANAGFWGLLAVSFLFGDRMGDLGNGVLVLGLALIGGLVGLGPAPAMAGEGAPSPRRLGGRVFLPLLIIPVVTLVGTATLGFIRPGGAPLVDPKQVTVISLALGIVIALGVAMVMTRLPLVAPVQEARRLLQSVGAAAILPQLLAALGAVFVIAGVGPAVQGLMGAWIPLDNRFAVVVAYCAGMAVFTMVVGNAFAAFPIMVAGFGAPLIVGRFGGDAAIMGALGMLSGFCGTLVTPMAAHNIIPTALAILVVNMTLMAVLVFHGR